MKLIKEFKEFKSMKKIVYIDMDDTICHYSIKRSKNLLSDPSNQFPQSVPGFFLDLDPIYDAIESIELLKEKYDVWILTRPSVKNLHCYTEKATWIKNHLGEDMVAKLILSPNKSLLKGSYLIDDTTAHGNSEFEGELIQFGTDKFKTWKDVTDYLL